MAIQEKITPAVTVGLGRPLRELRARRGRGLSLVVSIVAGSSTSRGSVFIPQVKDLQVASLGR